MKESVIISIVIIIFVCANCTNNYEKRLIIDIENLSKYDATFISKEWKIVWYENFDEDWYLVELSAVEGDTSFYLSYLSPIDRLIDCTPGNYYKSYTDAQYFNKLLIDGYDTCYFYRIPKKDSLIKEFIVGEYCYQNSQVGLLNNNQSNYYNLHSDSLRRIKGSNLPSLLEIPNDTTHIIINLGDVDK